MHGRETRKPHEVLRTPNEQFDFESHVPGFLRFVDESERGWEWTISPLDEQIGNLRVQIPNLRLYFNSLLRPTRKSRDRSVG